MRPYTYRRAALVAVVCLFIGIGVGAGSGVGMALGGQMAQFWTESPPGAMPQVQAPNFAELSERLQPAVVNISTMQDLRRQRRQAPGQPLPQPFGEPGQRQPFEEFFERFFGGGPQRELRRSLGSGFIINKDGHIVTNNHLVENTTDIKVSLADKEEFDAQVIGRDPETDVALIKIAANRDLPVAPLGNSDQLRVGDWVIAIGNPFGLGHTVTAGIASAKGRIIGAGPYDDFIQTDASINPGHSGGPLFNLNGEVVGVNTAITAIGQGIGFAIPINLAKDILLQLHGEGRVTRGWLGVQVQQVTPELAKSFGLERPRGALVTGVRPNSSVGQAGLQRGDVIVEFGGTPIQDMHELPRLVANTAPGTEVNVRLLRKGQERTVQVKVGEMAEKQQQATTEGGPTEKRLGLVVGQLTPEIARDLGMSSMQGVVVTNVVEGSPADDEGMRRGDVILEVNQEQVTTTPDYQAAVQRADDAGTVLLLVRRGDSMRYVTLRPIG
jgi:serine protease Do